MNTRTDRAGIACAALTAQLFGSAAQRNPRLFRPESGGVIIRASRRYPAAVVLAAQPAPAPVHLLGPAGGTLGILPRRTREIIRCVPVLDPLPDVAPSDRGTRTRWGRKGLDRRQARKAVPPAVLDRKLTLPEVRPVHSARASVDLPRRSGRRPYHHARRIRIPLPWAAGRRAIRSRRRHRTRKRARRGNHPFPDRTSRVRKDGASRHHRLWSTRHAACRRHRTSRAFPIP